MAETYRISKVVKVLEKLDWTATHYEQQAQRYQREYEEDKTMSSRSLMNWAEGKAEAYRDAIDELRKEFDL